MKHGARVPALIEKEIGMKKIVALAIAVSVIFASPVFAQEREIALGEGDAFMIWPDGSMHKSNTKVSDAKHDSALATGANEISRGRVYYKHGGKLYSLGCRGRYIGGWEQGYPGTEDEC